MFSFDISLRQGLLTLFLVTIALYTLFQARYLVLGPQITLLYPTDGMLATTSLIQVTGHAKNVTFISLDDRPIFLDQQGYFSESFLAPKGFSIIIMKARDRFGRETEKTTRIVLNE